MPDLKVQGHDLPTIPGTPILLTTVGSTLHGIGIGSDDTDLMGVTIEPTNTITGLGNFEHFLWRSAKKDERSGPDDIDLTVYGLKKYLRLAIKGNPSVITMLFAPDGFFQLQTQIGMELLELRSSIVSQQVKDRYLGYLRNQRHRAEVENRHQARGFATHDPRTPKWASHMVRLGIQGKELLRTGHLTLPMARDDAELCRAIKRGEIPFQSALELSEEHETAIHAISDSPLPEEPDVEAVEKWMWSVYARVLEAP